MKIARMKFAGMKIPGTKIAGMKIAGKMKKRLFFYCGLFLFLLPAGLNAQQITRFAVIDLTRVIETVKQNPKAQEEWNAHAAKIQADVDIMTNEIKQLRDKRADAVFQNDSEEADRLKAEIKTKEDALRTYYNNEKKKLDEEKAKLLNKSSNDKELEAKIMQEIENVAQEGGFSMVLDKNSRDIVWYSKTAGLDITDKVISRFQK